MSDQQWRLMNPVGDPPRAVFDGAGRPGDLSGKTLGLFWNGKPGGDVLLDEVALCLSGRFPGLDIVKFWEARPGTITAYGNSADNLRFMAQSADLVIGTNAD
ncbi:MAG: hypothetical protein A3I01_01550 [Betaproteobacteria bacterium RIFCSPLOWO2_02_FULL_65_24]|nr:MAG: hypothetical protein A3I01_01550 [Betaproteobacteria bacterium RIFCSPLOWO2_02_FULL_65_24]OGA96152.1 MAG: hypothetical protein A3G27_19695 [Betaproteobacteria bacterium RIFCSPLOWO2_12_FULL_66_14]